MFTEKERTILKALLEEEFQTIMSQGATKDILMNKYLFSLSQILNKVNVDGSGNRGLERFFTRHEELGAHQMAQ